VILRHGPRGERRAAARAAALALTLCAALAPPSKGAGGVAFITEREPLAVRSFRGTKVLEAVIKRPEPKGKPARLPALLVFGGFDTADKVLDLLEPGAPVVLATFGYPYPGEKRFRFPRTLLDAPAVKAAVRDTSSGIGELLRTLARKPYVDPDRLCVVGAGFGAPFALRAAAEEPGVSCLVLVHGFADMAGTIRHRLRQLWEPRLDGLAGPAAALISRLLVLYLDPPRPEEDAARLRKGQRVLLIEAARDTHIPPASRELLWRSLRRSQAEVDRAVTPGGRTLS